MWKAIASNSLTLLIVVLILVASVISLARARYTAPGPLADAVCFELERGTSLSATSRKLAQEGIISDPRIFRLAAHYNDQGSALKFGSYLIAPATSMESLLGQLTTGGAPSCGREINFRIGVAEADVVLRALDPKSGRYDEVLRFDLGSEAPTAYLDALKDDAMRYRVTLAEGVTSWQIMQAIGKADFMTGEISAQPAEGTLAPGSYEIEHGSDRTALITQMQRKQETILQSAWAERAPDLPYETMQEALIMASIIEKETSLPHERADVASVFVNRLRRNMALQTDPTVIYGVTEGKGVLGRGLRRSELLNQTPYNTYIYPGLPPNPIAHPGIDSIRAALNPNQTDYIFFVADGSGGHAFAKTLREHNENVIEWRKIESQQNKATTP